MLTAGLLNPSNVYKSRTKNTQGHVWFVFGYRYDTWQRIRSNSLRLPGSGGLPSRAGRDGVGIVVESTAVLSRNQLKSTWPPPQKISTFDPSTPIISPSAYYLICLPSHGIANFAFRLYIFSLIKFIFWSRSFFFSECRKTLTLGSIAKSFIATITKANFPSLFNFQDIWLSNRGFRWSGTLHITISPCNKLFWENITVATFFNFEHFYLRWSLSPFDFPNTFTANGWLEP